MEKILDIHIGYVDQGVDLIKFCINFTDFHILEISEQELNALNQKIEDLQEQLLNSNTLNRQKDMEINEIKDVIQKKTDIFAYKIDEITQKYESTKLELEKKNKETEEHTNTIEQHLNTIKEHEETIEKKTSTITKLQKTLKDREKNRTTSEVILEKQQNMNKELIEKNVKLEKQLQDTEKRCNESNKIIKKLKEEIDSYNEIMKQRDDQIKSVIKKVKIQETEMYKLQDDLQKKEELIKSLNSTIKDFSASTSIKTPVINHKDYKKTVEILNSKENEIQLMKEMLKSFQIKQSRPQVSSNINKNPKLPPISNERIPKSVEKHTKFREPNKQSNKFIKPAESLFVKSRKDTPPAKRTFKGVVLYPDEDLISDNPNIQDTPDIKFDSIQNNPDIRSDRVEGSSLQHIIDENANNPVANESDIKFGQVYKSESQGNSLLPNDSKETVNNISVTDPAAILDNPQIRSRVKENIDHIPDPVDSEIQSEITESNPLIPDPVTPTEDPEIKSEISYNPIDIQKKEEKSSPDFPTPSKPPDTPEKEQEKPSDISNPINLSKKLSDSGLSNEDPQGKLDLDIDDLEEIRKKTILPVADQEYSDQEYSDDEYIE